MATDSTGVTPQGFVTRSLSEIRDDFRASIQSQFGGATLDLSSTSLISQLTDVFANGLADLWAACAGVYASNYPAGATGVQVDQLLALSGLTRQAAKATVTNPTTAQDAGGNPLYGLVAFGQPGATLPAGTLLSNGASDPIQFRVDQTITIGAAANAQQSLQFLGTPTGGTYALQMQTSAGETLTSSAIDGRSQDKSTALYFPALSNSDDTDWYLTLGSQTVRLSFNADVDAVRSAIHSIAGFEQTAVSGSRATFIAIGETPSLNNLSFSGTNGPNVVLPSVRSAVWALTSADGKHAFGDVDVAQYGQGFLLNFGALSQPDGAPSTAQIAIPLVKIAQNTLRNGNSSVSVVASHVANGHPSQGIGSATATSAGATEILAGQLNTIVQSVVGVTSVSNQLDCVAGRDMESDADAIARLQSASAQTTATLSAIVNGVSSVPGVSQTIAFANDTNASSQILTFASVPTTGNFSLSVAGQTTASLPYSATSQDVQAALNVLPGLSDVTVTTAGASAFELQFGAQSGHQPHDLALVTSNTTGVSLTAAYGCPAHAVEVVAQGGDPTAIAQAILDTLPAGIASYGRAAVVVNASLAQGQTNSTLGSSVGVVAGQLADAAHLPNGTQLASLSGLNAVFSQAATQTNASEAVTFGYGCLLDDGAGNDVIVRFSRPLPVTVWVTLTLVTDKSTDTQWQPSSVASIQQTLISIINSVPIGKPVLVTGTRGLLNSFRDIPGIESASISIGRSSNPTSQNSLVLAPNETPVASSSSISIVVQ